MTHITASKPSQTFRNVQEWLSEMVVKSFWLLLLVSLYNLLPFWIALFPPWNADLVSNAAKECVSLSQYLQLFHFALPRVTCPFRFSVTLFYPLNNVEVSPGLSKALLFGHLDTSLVLVCVHAALVFWQPPMNSMKVLNLSIDTQIIWSSLTVELLQIVMQKSFLRVCFVNNML